MKNTLKHHQKKKSIQNLQRRLTEYLESRYLVPVAVRKLTLRRQGAESLVRAKFDVASNPRVVIEELFGVQRVGSSTEIWPVTPTEGVAGELDAIGPA